MLEIQKWGNSQGLHIVNNIFVDAHMDVGDEVDIIVKSSAIAIKPVKRYANSMT